MVFEQSLSGLIKALRASKQNESKVIDQALREIATEIKSLDWDLKAGAVLKLTYLEMLGFSHLSQHAFPIIECMSSPRFHVKQIGYLAASQSFMQGQEVVLLANNLIKKDLSNNKVHPSELLLTLSSLPPIINSSQQLATDLEPELIRQLSHSKPQVRRSAILVLRSLWQSSAASNETIIEKLSEKLLDDDQTVVGAAVNVILELAKNADQTAEALAPFLRLAPECFELLTNSNNNWLLIKVTKLFALLTPIEPRLVRKLLPPLTDLINTTTAMSLLYECLHALIAGGMIADNESLAQTCINKLAGFLKDADQNLRYIALLALTKILPFHPHLIVSHTAAVLRRVEDSDPSLRVRALDLLRGMANKDNLETITTKLLSYLSPTARPSAQALLISIASGNELASASANPAHRAALISLILDICSASLYANIQDFGWFIDLLFDLARFNQTLGDASLAEEIGAVLIDVSARVRGIRPYAVSTAISKLPQSCLPAASSWIIGEHCTDPAQWQPAIDALQSAGEIYHAVKVLARWSTHLSEADRWLQSGSLQAFAQSVENVATVAESQNHDVVNLLRLVQRGLPDLAERVDQHHARTQSLPDDNPFASSEGASEEVQPPPTVLCLLSSILFAYELNPVNEKAQGLVALPSGLDLDVPIAIEHLPVAIISAVDPDVDEFGRPRSGFGVRHEGTANGEQLKKPKKKKDKDTNGKVKKRKKTSNAEMPAEDEEDIDAIPIVKIDLGNKLPVRTRPVLPPMVIDAEGELPPGAVTPVKSEEVAAVTHSQEASEKSELVHVQPITVTKVKKSKSKRRKGADLVI